MHKEARTAAIFTPREFSLLLFLIRRHHHWDSKFFRQFVNVLKLE